MKTLRVVGYVAVAFACAPACGGSPGPSIVPITGDDGGAAEGGGAPSGVDAGTVDAGDLVSGKSEGGPGEGATNATSNAGPSQYCCVSGVYYDCASRAALAQCVGFDVSSCFQSCAPTDAACERACGQKASTAHTDPSACVHDASKDTVCGSFDAGSSSSSGGSGGAPSPAPPPSPAPAPAPPPPPTPKNVCGGPFLGTACTAGLQCNAGGHCTQNKCYPNDVGNPCTFTTDCGDGNHCTSGCCASPAKGSACATGLDCTSRTCTKRVCQ